MSCQPDDDDPSKLPPHKEDGAQPRSNNNNRNRQVQLLDEAQARPASHSKNNNNTNNFHHNNSEDDAQARLAAAPSTMSINNFDDVQPRLPNDNGDAQPRVSNDNNNNNSNNSSNLENDDAHPRDPPSSSLSDRIKLPRERRERHFTSNFSIECKKAIFRERAKLVRQRHEANKKRKNSAVDAQALSQENSAATTSLAKVTVTDQSNSKRSNTSTSNGSTKSRLSETNKSGKEDVNDSRPRPQENSATTTSLSTTTVTGQPNSIPSTTIRRFQQLEDDMMELFPETFAESNAVTRSNPSNHTDNIAAAQPTSSLSLSSLTDSATAATAAAAASSTGTKKKRRYVAGPSRSGTNVNDSNSNNNNTGNNIIVINCDPQHYTQNPDENFEITICHSGRKKVARWQFIVHPAARMWNVFNHEVLHQDEETRNMSRSNFGFMIFWKKGNETKHRFLNGHYRPYEIPHLKARYELHMVQHWPTTKIPIWFTLEGYSRNNIDSSCFLIEPDHRMGWVFDQVDYARFGLNGKSDVRFFYDPRQGAKIELLEEMTAKQLSMEFGATVTMVLVDADNFDDTKSRPQVSATTAASTGKKKKKKRSTTTTAVINSLYEEDDVHCAPLYGSSSDESVEKSRKIAEKQSNKNNNKNNNKQTTSSSTDDTAKGSKPTTDANQKDIFRGRPRCRDGRPRFRNSAGASNGNSNKPTTANQKDIGRGRPPRRNGTNPSSGEQGKTVSTTTNRRSHASSQLRDEAVSVDDDDNSNNNNNDSDFSDWFSEREVSSVEAFLYWPKDESQRMYKAHAKNKSPTDNDNSKPNMNPSSGEQGKTVSTATNRRSHGSSGRSNDEYLLLNNNSSYGITELTKRDEQKPRAIKRSSSYHDNSTSDNRNNDAPTGVAVFENSNARKQKPCPNKRPAVNGNPNDRNDTKEKKKKSRTDKENSTINNNAFDGSGLTMQDTFRPVTTLSGARWNRDDHSAPFPIMVRFYIAGEESPLLGRCEIRPSTKLREVLYAFTSYAGMPDPGEQLVQYRVVKHLENHFLAIDKQVMSTTIAAGDIPIEDGDNLEIWIQPKQQTSNEDDGNGSRCDCAMWTGNDMGRDNSGPFRISVNFYDRNSRYQYPPFHYQIWPHTPLDEVLRECGRVYKTKVKGASIDLYARHQPGHKYKHLGPYLSANDVPLKEGSQLMIVRQRIQEASDNNFSVSVYFYDNNNGSQFHDPFQYQIRPSTPLSEVLQECARVTNNSNVTNPLGIVDLSAYHPDGSHISMNNVPACRALLAKDMFLAEGSQLMIVVHFLPASAVPSIERFHG